MNLGNTNLVSHGIQTENADLRFHVSIATRSVYVFEPRKALKAIQTKVYCEGIAYTGNIKTARGYLIPPDDIEGCRRVSIPNEIFYAALFDARDNTSEKGKKAVFIVRKMISKGLLSLIVDTVDVNDKDMQIDGADILPVLAEQYQVKCDWSAGPRELGGTGNLYIQVAECNPLKRH